MKNYKVIYIDFPSMSFKWENGLFAVISELDGLLTLCKIDEFGKPNLFDGGTMMTCCTGSNNKGIKETELTINI